MAKAIWLAPLLFLAAEPTLRERSPETILWAAPSILFAAMSIAWAAESSQFFIAQGFALAILAWMQTLPEFAVEAVLAWHQPGAFFVRQPHRRIAAADGARLADDLLRGGRCASSPRRPATPPDCARRRTQRCKWWACWSR